MDIDPFGNHAKALALRSRRNEVLASNIANADTPGYKARDFDFRSAMQAAQTGNGSLAMTTTNAQHMRVTRGGAPGADPAIAYRIPHQPSVDGNTVEADVEQANYAENVVGYQASLMFLNRKIRGLQLAIKGGN